MQPSKYLLLLSLPLFAACSQDNAADSTQKSGLTITSNIERFKGENSTRANVEGTQFEANDLIRVKVICPYSPSTELGESTYSNSFDGFWLLRWTGSTWSNIPSSFGFDFNGDYIASESYSLLSMTLTQQTPYVFTASTWTEEKTFVVGSSTTLQYANVFHADQSNVKNFKASDVLWAQSILQTGTEYVHLSFQHVMSCLHLTFDSSVTLTDDAVVTLEGMPDIDQAEIIVGDQYASLSKINSSYGYRQKNAASEADNGKVLGIGVNDESAGTSHTEAISTVAQTAVYKPYRVANNEYRLILPPCTLLQPATIWVRDGARKWKAQLAQQEFQQGNLYNLTLVLEEQND